MKIIISENQKNEVLKNILFKFWDKHGYIKGDASTLRLFKIQPYRERQLIDQFIVEWYESRGKDRYEILKKDFKNLKEKSNGVYECHSDNDFKIIGDGYNFWIRIYKVNLDTKYNSLTLDGEIDFGSLTHNGEDVVNIPMDDMNDEEYFDHYNVIREDAYILANKFFIDRYGNTMALDVDLAA